MEDYSAVPSDSHLSLPITIEECEDVLLMKLPCKRHKVITDLRDKLKIKNTIYRTCHDPWGCLEGWVRRRASSIPPLEELLYAATRTTNAEVNFTTREAGSFQPIWEQYNLTSLKALYNLKCKADSVKAQLRLEFQREVINLGEVQWTANICVFECPIHRPSVAPTTLVLGVLDSLQRRFAACLYILLSDICQKYHFSLYPLFDEIDSRLIQLRSAYGEKFFSFLNSWHSLATGHVLESPSDLGFTDVKKVVLNSLQESLPGWQIYGLLPLILLPNLTSEHVAATLELAGLAKAYGHPCIQTHVGMQTMREFACSVKDYDWAAGEIARANFNYHYTKNFFKEHGRWPAHKCLANCHPLIVKHSLNHSWPVGEDMRSLSPRDWGRTCMEKELDYDFTPDVIDLLSDKACAPTRSKWSQTFDSCGFLLHHKLKRPFYGEREETRVLVRYLKGSEDELRDVLNEIDSRKPSIEDDICVLCPKEGEEKSEGRLFAKLTYRRRLYQTSTEHNIAQVMKYFPYQTMTISELELLKILGTMGRSIATGPQDDTIPINLDIKKFNMQFREPMVNPLFRELDNIFGFNWVYQDTHAGFDRSVYMTNLRTRPPRPSGARDPMPGTYCHYFQMGGCEGMRQKGWTLVTQVWILDFAYMHRYRIHLIGQGDNQVIMWKPSVHHRQDIRAETRLFMERLVEYMKSMQLPLKPEESWFSRHLLQYNKESYYKGAHLPNGIKYAMKMSPDSNELIDTIDNRVAALATVAEATARRDHSSIPAYFMYAFECILLCWREELFGSDKTVRNYASTPMWNRAIGGLPGTFLICLTQRGLTDRLTIQLALLKYLAFHEKELFSDLLKVSPCYTMGVPRYRILIMDPGALNLRGSMGVEPILRQEVQDCVRNVATNPKVTRLWSSEASIPEEELIYTLITMRPYHAQLATELFRCSDAGILRILCSLFEKTRSTVSLTIQKRKEQRRGSLISEARAKELEWITDIRKLWKMGKVNTYLNSVLSWGNCTTQLAEQMRENTWGFKVHGSTIPCPVEQTFIVSWDSLLDEKKKQAVLVSTSEEYRHLGNFSWLILGPYLTYYGNSTREQVRKSVTTQVEITTSEKATRRLETIHSWAQFVQSASLVQLIDLLLKEKGVSSVPSSPQIRGGNIFHRFHTARGKMSCLINNLSTINSHFSLGTSHMSKFSSGGEDHTIFYQSLFLYSCWYLHTVYGHASQVRCKTYGALLLCSGCTHPVPESCITIGPGTIGNVPKLRTSSVKKRGEIDLGVLVGKKLAAATFTYENDCCVNDYIHLLAWGGSSTSAVTIPMFRKADPRSVIWALSLRYAYLIKWARYYKIALASTPLTPASLVAFAGTLLKSGLLAVYCTWMNITPNHSGVISTSPLSHDLQLGCLHFIENHSASFKDYGAFYFEGENVGAFLHRIRRLEQLFDISLIECEHDLVCLGTDAQVENEWTTALHTPAISAPSQCQTFGKKNVWVGVDSLTTHEGLQEQTLPLPWPLYHLTRGCGIATSASSKYIQILSHQVLSSLHPDLVVCLAERDAGLLGTLLHKFPKARGIYNSLLTNNAYGAVEPTQFLPPGLTGCSLSSRIIDLAGSVTGETDLTNNICIDKIKKQIGKTNHDELLITMDADQQQSPVNKQIYNNLKAIWRQSSAKNKTLIIKTLKMEQSVIDINSIATSLVCFATVLKPSSSYAGNREFFIVLTTLSPRRDLITQSQIDSLFVVSSVLATHSEFDSYVSLGRDLRHLCPCTDLPSRDLAELTGMSFRGITPRKICRRIKAYLSMEWEDLYDDHILCHLMRVSGREHVLERTVIPLVILLEMCGRPPARIVTLFQHLSSTRIRVGRFNSSDRWPTTTSFSILVDENTVPSVMETQGAIFKKLVRAFIALSGKRRSDVPSTCLSQIG
jgi:hypothetical protein